MEDKQKVKARIKKKLKAVEKTFKKAKPIHRTAYKVVVYGYSSYMYEADDEYYYESLGDKH